ncbi:MAG: SagB/ThcOx family dehydrogenase, partial [Candidatus Hydrogenedentales bacterium]
HRFARSLGYLDWATQPDPFRRYAGAPLFHLPLAQDDTTPPYDAVYAHSQTVQPVTVETIARFFECSLALSAWKAYGSERWALRCNPSSGNLHPTEGYLIAPPITGLSDQAAVYHYAPKEHALELRTNFSAEILCESLRALRLCVKENNNSTQNLGERRDAHCFFVGLTSIHWREAWKYGERAFRYCQHDVGHALGALAFAAAANGWRVVHLVGLGDAEVARLLGIDRDTDFADAEREHPDLLVAVVPNAADARMPQTLDEAVVSAVAAGEWHGQANALSAERVEWEIIDAVAEATVKPSGFSARDEESSAVALPPHGLEARATTHATRLTLQQITKQRRSAVAMDGRTPLSRDAFYTMLARTMPSAGAFPWDVLGPPHYLHLALFVHRVDDLPPGLYMLVRDAARADIVRKAMTKKHDWTTPHSCPAALPLYRLQEEDCRNVAAQVSCTQEIAGDGAFSLGMIAEFERALDELGPWAYRRLFWESGLIGQVLYLEAEAAGVRATGIGCYFDDAVHQVFGFDGRAWQSMYHFTVGGPVDDWRLQTESPYPRDRAPIRGWSTDDAPREGERPREPGPTT